MKHTKGPWHSVQYGPYFIIQSDEFYGDTQLLSLEETPNAEANAKLAAAAPELLEALKEMLRHTDGNCSEQPTRTMSEAEEQAKKAILKSIS